MVRACVCVSLPMLDLFTLYKQQALLWNSFINWAPQLQTTINKKPAQQIHNYSYTHTYTYTYLQVSISVAAAYRFCKFPSRSAVCQQILCISIGNCGAIRNHNSNNSNNYNNNSTTTTAPRTLPQHSADFTMKYAIYLLTWTWRHFDWIKSTMWQQNERNITKITITITTNEYKQAKLALFHSPPPLPSLSLLRSFHLRTFYCSAHSRMRFTVCWA